MVVVAGRRRRRPACSSPAALGALIVRAALRPLRRVAATAGRVAELPLDRGEVALSVRVPAADTDPRTEVGQVGAALNRMLGHVAAALAARQASETRVRQFVADASHELRTPLAAIRGYAELARRGPGPVPPDVAHALRRVESESARMTSLVDDLLLLARLDSGRPLAAEPVDLTATGGGRGQRRPRGRPRTPAGCSTCPTRRSTVPGDAARLHQVVANLLANARTHTPPGSTVTTRLAAGGRRGAEISVADDGPGMPPELRDRGLRTVRPGRHARGRGRPAAPASAWPSWPPWWRPTTAPSPWRADRAAPSSPCGCRTPPCPHAGRRPARRRTPTCPRRTRTPTCPHRRTSARTRIPPPRAAGCRRLRAAGFHSPRIAGSWGRPNQLTQAGRMDRTESLLTTPASPRTPRPHRRRPGPTPRPHRARARPTARP